MVHSLDAPFVRDQLALRVAPVNARPARRTGEFVLYWMQSTHRLEENWALRHAVREADRLGLPVLVHQGLDPTYEHASDRIHAFILANARELAARADALGVTYRFALRRRRADDRRLVDRLAARAALVVTDLFPTAGVAERTARFAARQDVHVAAVESHCVVPAASLAKEEWAARTIRPKLFGVLDHALEPVADRPARRAMPERLLASLDVDWLDLRRADLAAEIAACEIDHGVPPVDARWVAPGRAAALARLADFLRDGLAGYAERRGNPVDRDGSSRLSPYLHFGQVSAAEVARAALAAAGPEGARKFLDELITWRELAFNFCLRNPHFGRLRGLPPWVHDSMARHRDDPREVTYALRELEAARTAYPLWNAAQRELVVTGAIHNVMRMYWGKSVLTWKARYGDALRDLIVLNNKWGLDGRDPSSFGGIQWCFGKFDRPWGERPVWGTIRSMSLARAYQKFDAAGYERRWLGEALPPRG